MLQIMSRSFPFPYFSPPVILVQVNLGLNCPRLCIYLFGCLLTKSNLALLLLSITSIYSQASPETLTMITSSRAFLTWLETIKLSFITKGKILQSSTLFVLFGFSEPLVLLRWYSFFLRMHPTPKAVLSV